MQPTVTQEDVDSVTRILAAKTLCDVMGVNEAILKQPNYVKLLKKVYFKLSLQVHPDKNYAPRSVEAFHILDDSYKKLIAQGVNRNVSSKIEVKTPVVAQPVYRPKPPVAPQPSYQYKSPPDFEKYLYEEIMRKARQANPGGQEEFTDAQQKLYEKLKSTCRAKTQNGTNCTKQAQEGSQYCYVHRDYGVAKPKVEKTVKEQCQANTKEGSRCIKLAQEGKAYCSIHLKYDPSAPRAEPVEKVKCAGTTKLGNPCQSYAQKDRKFCKSH